MLNTIFFDAVGTLIHLPRPVGIHYAEVGERFGLDVDATLLEKAFRAEWADSPPRTAGGGPRLDDDKGWWQGLVIRVLQRTLTERRFSTFDVAGYFEAVYAHFSRAGVWETYPETPEVLTVLQSRGFNLGVISNFDRRLYQIFGHLGLADFFTAVVISSEVGADKPDPAIFKHALDRMGVPAAQAMHVGDDPRCDGGATAVGLRIFALERPRHTLRDLLPALDGELPTP